MNSPVPQFKENSIRINNIFFQILRIFKKAFECQNQFEPEKKNPFYIEDIFGAKSNDISKELISFLFEFCIKEIIQQCLKQSIDNPEDYLKYLEVLYLGMETLLKDIQKIDCPMNDIINDSCSKYFLTISEELTNDYLKYEIKYIEMQIPLIIQSILQPFEKLSSAKNIMEKFEKKIFSDKKNLIRNLSKKEREKEILMLDELFLSEKIENIFTVIKSSLNRANVLSQKINHIFTILDVFLDMMGNKLFNNLLIFIGETIPGFNRKTPLNEDFFSIISQANVLGQRLEILYASATEKILANSKSEFENYIAKKDSIFGNIRSSIHDSIQHALGCIFIQSLKILSEKQGKNDFILKSEPSKGYSPTEACSQFIQFLRKYINKIKLISNPAIKWRILSSLGNQVVDNLIGHYINFKVNSLGYNILETDLWTIGAFLSELEDLQVLNNYKNFKSLCSIHKCNSPEEVNKYAQDENLVKLFSLNVIQGYAKQKIFSK